jgi:hypothetical protein
MSPFFCQRAAEKRQVPRRAPRRALQKTHRHRLPFPHMKASVTGNRGTGRGMPGLQGTGITYTPQTRYQAKGSRQQATRRHPSTLHRRQRSPASRKNLFYRAHYFIYARHGYATDIPHGAPPSPPSAYTPPPCATRLAASAPPASRREGRQPVLPYNNRVAIGRQNVRQELRR